MFLAAHIALVLILSPMPLHTTIQSHTSTVPVQLIPQPTCCWCWAASGQMVMKYFGVNVGQCQQAAKQFNVSNCCATPYPNACVKGGVVLIGDYGFTFAQNGAAQPLTYAQMQQQTDVRREPWIFNYVGTGFGHVLVGVGYETITFHIATVTGAPSSAHVEQLVAVNDPWPPGTGATYFESYAQYVSGVYLGSNYQDGYDIYNITPPPHRPIVPRQVVVTPATIVQVRIPPHWPGPIGPDPMSAASNALIELRALAAGGGERILGITASVAQTATLGQPMRIYTAPVDRLRAHTATANVAPVIVATQSYVYPVMANGREVTTIEVSEISGQWVGHSFGRASLARSIAAYRTAPTDKLIFVPSANELFIGKGEKEQLRVTPIATSVKLGFVQGREITGAAALQQLVPEARAYDGKPR
jgi:hypothetical protein